MGKWFGAIVEILTARPSAGSLLIDTVVAIIIDVVIVVVFVGVIVVFAGVIVVIDVVFVIGSVRFMHLKDRHRSKRASRTKKGDHAARRRMAIFEEMMASRGVAKDEWPDYYDEKGISLIGPSAVCVCCQTNGPTITT